MILVETDQYLVIDKPAGMFVHPPSNTAYSVRDEQVLIKVLKQKHGQPFYPVHRLDYGTSGLLLMAKQKIEVEPLAQLFREHKIQKSYLAVVRGYLEDEGEIAIPLEVNFGKELAEARTSYSTLARLELPVAIGKRHPTSRYSLVLARPSTGRWHQIRRHFDRIAHPLIGDIEHGDTAHNRYFRDELKIAGLNLRANKLEFVDPFTNASVIYKAPTNQHWQKIAALFSHSF